MVRRLWLVTALAGLLAAGGVSCDKGNTVVAPTLAATCAATPSTGSAPLTVAFSLNVAGAQGSFSVAIDYGDGTQGTDPGSPHVYKLAGAFIAAFTVSTSSQTARCSTAVTVSAAPSIPPPNQPPTPFFKTTPSAAGSTITGKAPLTVGFNLCRTGDPEGDVLQFRMDLDGNGVFEYVGSTGADCRHDATYAAGTHSARICVTDVDCTTWPACWGAPPLHPFQCKTYTVVATP
jgi:PKD repeat protein